MENNGKQKFSEPSAELLEEQIKKTDSWKAAGWDCISGFWWKRFHGATQDCGIY